ncbi:MAG TPA: glycosyl hydrolase family 8 [Polyangia bacterium]
MPPPERARLSPSLRFAIGSVAWAFGLACGAGCRSTVDSLGYDDVGGIDVLHPIKGPRSYPNAFKDIGKTDPDIQTKIDRAFAQLFHGDPSTQAIYVPVPGQADQAYIADTFHTDIRTEGIGLGMLIALQLDKRDEFDKLWTYAQAVPKQKDGASRGYFMSSCAMTASDKDPCLDPYGMEHMLMALLLANQHWSAAAGSVDYAAGAKDLLTVMRHKEDENGGVVDGITNLIDPTARLVFDLPLASAAGKTRPSVVTPAFYDLWSQATADPFWSKAASAAREYLQKAAHPTTGLFPLRSDFAGLPEMGGNTFVPETYRTFVNIVIDQIWTSANSSWEQDEVDKVLGFFTRQGLDTYGKSYSLDGTVIETAHEPSLIMVNGITALDSKVSARRTFIQEVWDRELPVGPARYFTGIFQMLALLILGGQFQVR